MSYVKGTEEAAGIAAQAVVGVGVIIAGLSAVGFAVYYFSAPAVVAVQNRTFHESQPYNDGMARDLENFQVEYLNAADQGKKDAIRAIVMNRFGGYDPSRLPANLQLFLSTLRAGG